MCASLPRTPLLVTSNNCDQLLFVEARRAELKDQKPELKTTEVSKVGAL